MPVAWRQNNASRDLTAGHVTHTLSTTGNTLTDSTLCGTVWWTSGTVSVTGVTVQGNAATLVDNPITTGSFRGCSFYYAGTAAAACQVIASFDGLGVNDSRMVIHEATGVLTSADPLDVHNGKALSNPAGANSVTTDSVTTTQDGEYIFASTSALGGGATVTAGTNYTIRDNVQTRNSENYTTPPSAGALVGSFTPSGNETWITFVVTFKAADGGSSNALWAQSLM